MSSSSVKCPSCGLVSFANVESCKRCGASLGATDAVALHDASGKAQLERPQKETNRKAFALVLGIVGFLVLILIVGAIRLSKARLEEDASTLTPASIARVTLRSQFVQQIKPQTEKLATDLFILCRDAEKQRVDAEAERLSRVMRDNDNDPVKSQGDKARTLFGIQPEVRSLQEEMKAFKEISPTRIDPQLAGPESDTLFYNVTGGLARNVLQRFTHWWDVGSPDQQNMASDLRRLGFKSVIVGNSIVDGQRFDLGK